MENKPSTEPDTSKPDDAKSAKSDAPKKLKKEIGGTDGPEPTRYGDWEHKGIISDF